MIKLEHILSNYTKINKCEDDDYTKALECMIINDSDIVYYLKTRKFYINNIAVLEVNKNGLSHYDIELNNNDGDLITNIKCDVTYDLLLGGVNYNTNKVMMLKSEYHSKIMRLYLDPNNLPEYINISYDCCLFNTNIRNNIKSHNMILYDGLVYYNGMITEPKTNI